MASPQPRALEVARIAFLQLGKRCEQSVQHVAVNADARIGDGKQYAVFARLLGRQRMGVDRNRALVGELDGIAHQVAEHLLQANGIAKQHGGDFGVDRHPQFQSFFPGAGFKKLHDGVHDVFEIKRLHGKFHPARLHLGKIQNIGKQPRQPPAGLKRVVHIGFLLAGKGSRVQKMEHAHYAVEGRTYLVAHIGEKLRFRGIGFLGLLPGLFPLQRVTLQLFGHAVHCACQRAYLPAVGLQAGAGLQVARPQAPGHRDQFRHSDVD